MYNIITENIIAEDKRFSIEYLNNLLIELRYFYQELFDYFNSAVYKNESSKKSSEVIKIKNNLLRTLGIAKKTKFRRDEKRSLYTLINNLNVNSGTSAPSLHLLLCVTAMHCSGTYTCNGARKRCCVAFLPPIWEGQEEGVSVLRPCSRRREQGSDCTLLIVNKNCILKVVNNIGTTKRTFHSSGINNAFLSRQRVCSRNLISLYLIILN